MAADESSIRYDLKDKSHKTVDAAMLAPSGVAIYEECLQLARFLIEKNIAYGDSALSPVRMFSTASPEEQLRVRIDDKLSRLSHWPGKADAPIKEDAVLDLLGYLVLLRIATVDKVEL